MKNRLFIIFFIAVAFVSILPYFAFAANVEGYTVISGTFDDIPNGFCTDSMSQSLIIKDELLSEGKISAEFSNNVKKAQYPVGIVFAGKGIREYADISSYNICYLMAYFKAGTVILEKNENGIDEQIITCEIDQTVFDSPTVRLTVIFSSEGDVKILVNDTEVINKSLTANQIYGGEMGIRAGGDGNKYEISSFTATDFTHTEHTAGEIFPEIKASCMEEGKKEYSICTVCSEFIYNNGGVWTLITEAELIIPKDMQNHLDKKEDIQWTYNESTHQKICQCGTTLASGNHSIDPNALEGTCNICNYTKVHICNDFTRIYAVEGNCITKGTIEHYKCNDCGKLCIRSGNAYVEKSRADLETEINANNHIDSEETLEWTHDDSKHYKICRCGKIFSSAKHDISQSALEGKCSVCNYSKTHICTYTEIHESPASCISKGEKAHYKCELCKKLYIKSGNEYLETDAASLVIEKDPSNHVDSADTLDWTYDANAHKKVCRCKSILVSESHDIDSEALDGICSVCGYTKKHTCEYTKIAKKSASCIDFGKKEHYKCNACGKLYIRSGGEYLETVESELVIEKDPTNHIDTIASLPWVFDDSGHRKICRCGTVRESSGHSIRNALEGECTTCGYVRVHTCTYTEISEIPANCMENGMKSHYRCDACEKLYVKYDEAYIEIDKNQLVIEKDLSNHVDSADTLDWTYDANAHKKVCRCNSILVSKLHDIDSDAIEGICSVCGYTKKHTCDYTKIAKKSPNCIDFGEKEHYRCNACGKLYVKANDEYVETTRSELVLPKDPTSHIDTIASLPWTFDDSGHRKICRCGAVRESSGHSIRNALEGECTTCGYVRVHTCTYTEISEIPASCMEKGVKSHYVCYACEKLYVKLGDSYIETEKNQLVIEKDPSNHIDSVETLDWTHDANVHKKVCRCKSILASGSHGIASDALEGVCSVCGYTKNHTCKYAKVAKKAASCIDFGEKEHYKCNDCGKLYIKANGEYIETTRSELVLAKDPTSHIDTIASLPWTFDDSGHRKICRCGAVRESSGHSIRNALEGECTTCGYVRVHTCTYAEIPETPASCMTKGEIAHYICVSCKNLYIKSGNKYLLTDKSSLVIAKDPDSHIDVADDIQWSYDKSTHSKLCRCGVKLVDENHNFSKDKCTVCGYERKHICTYIFVNTSGGGCLSESIKAHYKCDDCGRIYLKSDGIYIETALSDITFVTEHSLKKYYADKDHGAYWECKECGLIFSDERGENILSEIPKIEEDTEKDIPKDDAEDNRVDKTKDNSILLYVILFCLIAIIILLAVLIIQNRKRFAKG